MRANWWHAVAVGIALAGACSLAACGSGAAPTSDAGANAAAPGQTSGGTLPASAPASAPGSATPGSSTPGSATPGSETPGSEPPGSATPGIGDPGSPRDGAPGPGRGPSAPSSVAASQPAASTTRPFALGWYTDTLSFNAQQANAMPVKPSIVNYYSPWLESFETSFAEEAYADGIETFVELEPWNCAACAGGQVPSMTSIAAGAYDGYLTSLGQQIEAFGHPVMVTFAHEMNGSWYPWGDGGSEHATPAQWIATWDHVVTVVSAEAPGLVNWVWAPNIELNVGPVAPYWPGDKYVSSVGIDGYFSSDSDTYSSIFAATVADVRRLTNRPIWIAETGLNIDATTGTRLSAYVAAVKAAGLSGLLYFDVRGWALSLADQRSLAIAISTPVS